MSDNTLKMWVSRTSAANMCLHIDTMQLEYKGHGVEATFGVSPIWSEGEQVEFGCHAVETIYLRQSSLFGSNRISESRSMRVRDDFCEALPALGFANAKVSFHSELNAECASFLIESDLGPLLPSQKDLLGELDDLDFSQKDPIIYSGLMGFNFLLASKAASGQPSKGTIESTPGGQFLKSKFKLSAVGARLNVIAQINASRAYARSVTGNCHTFVSASTRDRIFRACELKVLVRNPNIHSINGIDRSLFMDILKKENGDFLCYQEIVKAEFRRDELYATDPLLEVTVMPSLNERRLAHQITCKLEQNTNGKYYPMPADTRSG